MFTRSQIEVYLGRLLPLITPFCDRVEVCGSYRRQSEESNDVDIVLKPIDDFSIFNMLVGIDASPLTKRNIFKGPHMIRYEMKVDAGIIPTELYLTRDDRQFEVMKLIRTGDWVFNKRLCMNANSANMSLRFSAKHYGVFGLFRSWNKDTHKKETVFNPIPRKDCQTEQEIVTKLMGKYYEPPERSMTTDETKPLDDIDQEETDKNSGISTK